MRAAFVPCEECDGRVRAGDEYCTDCGIPVTSSVKAAIDARRAEKEQHEQAKTDAVAVEAARQARTLAFARWALLLLAMLELGQGLLSFPEYVRQSSIDVAELVKLADSYVWVDDHGDSYTKGELLRLEARRPGSMLVGKTTISGLLLLLLVIARRAPVAALLAASLAYFATLLAGGWDGGIAPKAVLLMIVIAGARAAVVAAKEPRSPRLRSERALR